MTSVSRSCLTTHEVKLKCKTLGGISGRQIAHYVRVGLLIRMRTVHVITHEVRLMFAVL